MVCCYINAKELILICIANLLWSQDIQSSIIRIFTIKQWLWENLKSQWFSLSSISNNFILKILKWLFIKPSPTPSNKVIIFLQLNLLCFYNINLNFGRNNTILLYDQILLHLSIFYQVFGTVSRIVNKFFYQVYVGMTLGCESRVRWASLLVLFVIIFWFCLGSEKIDLRGWC